MKLLQLPDQELLEGPGRKYVETYFSFDGPQALIDLPAKVGNRFISYTIKLCSQSFLLKALEPPRKLLWAAKPASPAPAEKR